ncbi:MAG: TRAP transporter substrate-binding protein [Proteobacteria bacterium]|nr:TRAP transporter substrate-binding protein [Pseudomonadota bacterium]
MPVTLKLSHYMPPDHGTHRDFIAPWAQALEREANGEIKVELFDGTTSLGLLANQYDQVASGIVDVAHSPAALPAGRFPRSLIAGMPFLVDGAEAGTRLLWRLLPEFLAAEYGDLHVLALHADSGGLIHTRERPVARLEDIKGLRLRTPNALITAAIARLGAVPVQMPPPEINAALREGRIDGACMPWDVVGYTQSAEFLRYHLDTRLYVAPLYFVMNRVRYDGLPPHLRQAVDAVSGPALVARFGEWWRRWEAAGIDEVRALGHPINVLSADERARWAEAVQPAIGDWLAEQERHGVRDARAIYQAAREFGATAMTR